MRRAVSYLPLALLFLASAVPSNGQNVTTTAVPAEEPRTADDFDGEVMYYEVKHTDKFKINCTIGGAISWKKNGTALEALEPELRSRIVLKPYEGVENAQLTISGRAYENDFGNYTCSNAAGNQQNWKVMGRPHAKLEINSNVVEGQKLKLTCKVIGRPFPLVQWTYSNISEYVNDTGAIEITSNDRVKLSTSDQGVENGDLIIERAEQTDAGWYKCSPLADAKADAVPSITRLRVKDMYAALWPFLGICAEVFVLCAIILVYEKRRTKPELDDSDTDNHDQKKS